MSALDVLGGEHDLQLPARIGKADGLVSIFIDAVWFGVGSGGVHYLGQSHTKSWAGPWPVDSPAATRQ